ncbi:MAG: 30S ribosomal protein S12 methylthiotransferase RimO, partial [Oscillospiraceae bacterium]|nr:30S ribosomal protein S12 methylthiotransferase RimO [Oscillospiraceae bacterium]
AGAFAYSPEEGTEAERMERVDRETAERRAELVELLQQEVMAEFNASRIGTTVTVLCEDYDGEFWYGRSYAESPDIDGAVAFEGEGMVLGGFYDITITGEIDGTPVGRIAE